jgi:hypothetical protein
MLCMIDTVVYDDDLIATDAIVFHDDALGVVRNSDDTISGMKAASLFVIDILVGISGSAIKLGRMDMNNEWLPGDTLRLHARTE